MHALRSISPWLMSVVMLALALPAGARDLPDFSELAAQNSPMVVNISTRQTSQVKRILPKGFEMPELPEGSPFNELFRHFFEDQLEGLDERERKTQSLGSGFIISPDGYILTNHHVVDGADEIIVRLTDRRVYEAKVVGSDRQSDVALVKIDAEGLPVVKIGKSATMKVGEWVLAIGSPFGFDHTVTAGIVSAKGRSLPSESYVPFIQTDVAINPGNSGGPLFNLDGEVVGVNSQIYSRTGGFMGLSFAIPIELAMNVAEQLRTKGRVSRGYLGVLIQDVDRNLAESFGLAHPRGALVARVLPDSPAEAAGLETGDIILEFNGQRLQDSSQLPPLVGASQVDGQSRLKVLRAGKEREILVQLGELPVEQQAAAEVTEEAAEPTRSERLGLQLKELTAEQREQLGLPADQGLLVEGLTAGPAQAAGMRRGDVVLMVSGAKVGKVADLEAQVADLAPGQSVAVLVQRGDNPLFLALRIPEAE
jgi:serine protease Do